MRRVLTAVTATAAVLMSLHTVAEAQLVEDPEWSGDYQTGDLSQWSQVHAVRQDAITVVNNPTRDGYAKSARFEVRPGDRWNSVDTERAEVMASKEQTQAAEGREQYYGWSALFPAGTSVQRGGWLSFMQWHQEANTCAPNLAFRISDSSVPRLQLTVRGGRFDATTCIPGQIREFDLGVLPTDSWTDFALRASWSSDPSRGSVEVKLGGRVVLPATAVANLYHGQGAYLKQGIYRSLMDRTTTIYQTGTLRGSTAASVAPPPTDSAPGSASAVPPAGKQCIAAARNVQRTADSLVVYDRTTGRTTSPANTYGFEAAVLDERVTGTYDRQTGTGIPPGGHVLSGHDTAADWLRANLRVDTPVTVTYTDAKTAQVCLSQVG